MKFIKHAVSSQDEGRLARMVKMASSEPGVAVRASEFDADPYVLNVKNGTLDLRTGELREHSRADKITRLAPVEYHGGLIVSRWDTFLDGLFPDEEVRRF